MNAAAARGKRIRVKQERFLPYAHARLGLQLEVRRCEVDGRSEPDAIDRDRHLVNVDEARWDVLALELEIRLDSDAIDRTFPPDDRQPEAGAAWVLVRCEDTRLRRALALGRVSSPTPLRGTLQLERDEIHGLVELRPMVTRNRPTARAAPGYASQPGMRLAGGRPWEVRAERLRPVQGKFLEVRYQSFAGDAQLARHAACIHHLESDVETPRLWINKDHGKVTAIMDDRGTRGPKARMREVFFDMISHTVWTQLFVRAATHVHETGDTVHDWETSVLQQLLPPLYPRARSHSQRLDGLRNELEKGEWTQLLGRLDGVLQERHQVAKHMSRLVEEAVESDR